MLWYKGTIQYEHITYIQPCQQHGVLCSVQSGARHPHQGLQTESAVPGGGPGGEAAVADVGGPPYRGSTAPPGAKAVLGMRKANCPSEAGSSWKPPYTLAASAPGLQGMPGSGPVPLPGGTSGGPKAAAGGSGGGGGGRRVVHGVDLGHAAGQVAQEPGAHLSVDALAGGEEPCHLVHALAEAGAVLAQHRGVCAQCGCRGREAHSGQPALQGMGTCSLLVLGPATPPSWESRALWQRVLCSWVPRIWTESTAPLAPGTQVGNRQPQESSCALKHWGSRLGAQSPWQLSCFPSPQKRGRWGVQLC